MENNIFDTTVRRTEGKKFVLSYREGCKPFDGFTVIRLYRHGIAFCSKVFRVSRSNSLDSHWYSVCVI